MKKETEAILKFVRLLNESKQIYWIGPRVEGIENNHLRISFDNIAVVFGYTQKGRMYIVYAYDKQLDNLVCEVTPVEWNLAHFIGYRLRELNPDYLDMVRATLSETFIENCRLVNATFKADYELFVENLETEEDTKEHAAILLEAKELLDIKHVVVDLYEKQHVRIYDNCKSNTQYRYCGIVKRQIENYAKNTISPWKYQLHDQNLTQVEAGHVKADMEKIIVSLKKDGFDEETTNMELDLYELLSLKKYFPEDGVFLPILDL